MSAPLKVTIATCPRCAREHKGLRFVPFERRPAGPYTHWALCPVFLEPVLHMTTTLTLWQFIRALRLGGAIKVSG